MSRDPQDRQQPIDVKDDTPFPVPELYFKVFDSEKDEPDSVVRQDVLKLYERWEKKYGRKWPENGLNTEDLVWLEQEAYNEDKAAAAAALRGNGSGGKGGSGGASSSKRKTYPVERVDYDGQFLDATEEVLERATAKLPTDPKARAAAIQRAKEDVEDAAWVTDEFESEDYEAGNLELLHNQYLWDREGKPTLMPDGPPDEAKGEGSDEWDDVYASWRPRNVDTDDMREALWCTDEFESDEDNTESEWEPEFVGMGLGLKAEDPMNPQYSLRHSTHPLAPFPGEPLKWASYVYDDGTTYEGLTRDAIAHGMGVMTFGEGTGGGLHLREVKRGDKYEGEFQGGYAHGLGQFTSSHNGEVFIGEFFAGQRHGCGLRVDMSPMYYLMERGIEPLVAYRKTHDHIMRSMEFATWYRGQRLGDNGEDEAVVVAVRDDASNPWDVLVKNALHEEKVKAWKHMTREEKVLSKMEDILLQSRRKKGFAYTGTGRRVRVASDDPLCPVSELEDSIELMNGNTSEGGLGPGWQDATQDELDLDDVLRTQMANEVAADRLEEQEDKEMVLGGDILNPYTGLRLLDYLEGREAEHNELLQRVTGVDPAADSTTYLDTGDASDVGGDTKLGYFTETSLAANMAAWEKYYEDSDPELEASSVYAKRNWAEEHTDTRFETESDMMEMCDMAEILGTIDEAQQIVNRARMWRWKPYGEVTLRFAQDAAGAPVETMQDPLHYPHGTKFMAPGPLGQCHPIPDNPDLRRQMLAVAKDYERVYSMYNFDWDPEPGSAQWVVDQRVKRVQEINLGRMARAVNAAAEAEEAAAVAGGPQLVAQVAEAEPLAPAAATTSSSSCPAASSSTSRHPSSHQQQQQQPWFGLGGAPFASVTGSMGIGRASRAVLNLWERAAKRAPPVNCGRPRLSRPSTTSSRRQQQQQQQQQPSGAVAAVAVMQQRSRMGL